MSPHRYASRPTCVYCDAEATAAGEACAVAAEVEADWTSRVPGGYEPILHLRALVEGLRRRTGEDWTIEHVAGVSGGGPEERFIVRRGGAVVVEAASVVRDLAARKAGAGLWRRGGRG